VYTFKHGPVHLIYSEAFGSEAEALTRERQLKRWTRGKKEALIAGDLDRLKHLSNCTPRPTIRGTRLATVGNPFSRRRRKIAQKLKART